MAKTRYTIDTFRGYNHGLKINAGEFYEMKNLTSSYFPVFSPRHKRAEFNVGGDVHSLYSKDKILYVQNGELYYGGKKIIGFPYLYPKYNEVRRMVSMGAYVVIFPDKVYLNTADLSDYGSIEAHFSTEEGTNVDYTLCTLTGENYENYSTGNVAPTEAENGALWLDTSDIPHVLKKYSETDSMWVSIATTYVKIVSPNIGKSFKEYDCVTISGSVIEDFNTDMIIWACSDDYIVVAGVIDEITTQNTAFAVDRKCPDMDFVCQGENRIWGCNSELNEIYCCKLGDFKNWRCYMGLASDSYTVSVGSDGDFTGAIRYGYYTLFFKENCIHKVYGTNPPFEIGTNYVRGVQNGSDKSLCVVNETLFYKSPTGICAYEGGSPVTISDNFGTLYYDKAIGGAFRDKYYISMHNNGKRELFVYDLNLAMWHKEDDIEILEMANNKSNLYMVVKHDDENILQIIDSEQAYGAFTGSLAGWSVEDAVEWEAVTGLIGLDVPEKKYFNRLICRMEISEGSTVNVFVEYDSSGEWLPLKSITAQKTYGTAFPINPDYRCDHFRIKLTGTGDVKIYSLTFNLETGSEMK
ncbi:MAG: hypothetical protein ACI4IF_02305 [Acutalibacteraceae bacterium]